MRRVAFILLSMIALTIGRGPDAGAHSTLIDSCPFAGDVVPEVSRIALTFGTPVIEDSDPPPMVELAGDLGRIEIPLGPVELVTDTELSVEVPDPLEPGIYIVRYRVLSVDGDESDGGFEFTIDPEADAGAACGGDGGGSGAGGWILLTVGVVAVGALALVLRPRRRPDESE